MANSKKAEGAKAAAAARAQGLETAAGIIAAPAAASITRVMDAGRMGVTKMGIRRAPPPTRVRRETPEAAVERRAKEQLARAEEAGKARWAAREAKWVRPEWLAAERAAEEWAVAERVRLERARLPRTAKDEVRDYATGLKDILNDLMSKGRMDPIDAQRYWDNVAASIARKGLTPNLPYYEQIQWQMRRGTTWAKYAADKASILGANLTYSDKIEALREVHPYPDDPNSFWQIKREVFQSLPPDEKAFLTRGTVTPELNRLLMERYDASRAKAQGIDFYGWLNAQSWATFKISHEPAPPEPPMYPRPPRPPTRVPTPIPRPPRYILPPPAPRFELPFQAGTQSWRDWFERKYQSLLQEYAGREEEPTEAGWGEFLKQRTPEIKEEWWSLGPYGRGEHPSMYQPLIRTVKF